VETSVKIQQPKLAQAQENALLKRKSIAAWKVYTPIAAASLVIVSQFYFFRELEVALLFFTVLFLMIAAIGGAIYLIGRVSQKTFSIAEPAARRGLVYAEVISRKTFHRPRSVPVP
jgi:hypothetical protein